MKKKLYLLLVMLSALVSLLSFNVGYSINVRHKIPVIIDTDAGWDDWIAIAYLIGKEKTSNYNIIGIVSNGVGEAHLKPGAMNISRIVSLSDHAEIPVYYGSNKSLKYNNHFPITLRDSIDNLFNIKLSSKKYYSPHIDGIDFIKNSLKHSKHKINFLAIGGLTDLALALKDEPWLAHKINMLTIMGGSFDFSKQKNQTPKGNIQDFQPSEYPTNTTAEWNIFIDPTAVKVVLNKVKNITIIPLNATRFIPLTQSFVNTFPSKTSLQKFIHEVIKKRYLDATRLGYTENFYDPLAAVISTHDSNVSKFVRRNVYVVTRYHPKQDRLGTTLWSNDNNHIRIAINTDSNLFRKELLKYC